MRFERMNYISQWKVAGFGKCQWSKLEWNRTVDSLTGEMLINNVQLISEC